MRIEPLTNGSLRVWLSEEELDKWGIDSDGPAQRRAVRRLLRRIFLQAEQPPPSRLCAELIPVDGGGVLLVTPSGQIPSEGPWVYCFADTDSLLDFVGCWRRISSASPPYLCLYAQGDGYALAVYSAEPLSRYRHRLLNEYGRLKGVGEGVAAYLGEHSPLLAAGDLFTAPAPPLSANEDPPC